MTLKQTRDISTLKNWDKNPRTIAKKDFERLKKQIQKLGEYKPLLITKDGTVLGGNMRLKAYQELGIKEVWVSVVEADTEEKKIEYALSDNDRAGKYELDLMGDLVGNFPDLQWADYSIDIDAPKTVDKFINMFPEEMEDTIPEVVDDPLSKLGEVYQLGRHRLMCGDATNKEIVDRLVNGNKIDLVVTDPPYNTGMTSKTNTFDYDWGKKKHDSTRLNHMFKDDLTPEQFKDLIEASLTNMSSVTKGECVFYVFIDWRNLGFIKEQLEKLMPVKNVIVWDKVVHGLGSDYKFTYEMCVVGKKGKPEINNRIGADYQDIWRVQRTMGRNEDHATAKPLELLKKPVLHASKEDDIVLDLFGGSGSTLIACEQTNRICYMMELDPKYCDVIRKRYAKFIGKEDEWQKVTAQVDQAL